MALPTTYDNKVTRRKRDPQRDRFRQEQLDTTPRRVPNSNDKITRQSRSPQRNEEMAIETLSQQFSIPVTEIKDELQAPTVEMPSFPMVLFSLNLIKDLLVDIPGTAVELTGVGIFVMGALKVFLFIANFAYYWGKFGKLKRYMAKRIFWIIVLLGVGSVVPFAKVIIPESLLIFLAHQQHRKVVREFFDMLEREYKHMEKFFTYIDKQVRTEQEKA